jgi:lipoprotein-anchoring transpeptidase ErfK/SrfK/peptidoglycan hydrolase-like protein with peptidoglycan-binding domain
LLRRLVTAIGVWRVRCGVYDYERGEAVKFAQSAVVAFTTWLGVAALLMVVAAGPAEAKKRKTADKSTEQAISDPANGEPMTLVVSLSDQTIDVYRGTMIIASSKVSSGMPGHATEAGVFSILDKERYHRSNIYSAAPMPWMQRLTWSGVALHGGVVPGYPASHGCIRLPSSFASKLFQVTTLGENVVVAVDRAVPELIEHPTLFQPRPPPSVIEDEEDPKSLSSDATAPSTPHLASDAYQVSEVSTTPAPDAISSVNVTKLRTEAKATSIEAAEPRSAPLRILVTRRTKRDRIIGVQYALSAMGYLEPQDFDGTFGRLTVDAIKAFQKDQGLPQTGAFTDDLVKSVYAVAGEKEPPEGHLFVRQGFQPVFDIPIAFRNPEKSLGTHLFTAMKFAPGATKTQWMAISLEGDDARATLDRLEIPDDARQKISERLTPGSSLIIGDKSVDSAILPDGGDFLVLLEETPMAAGKSKAKQAVEAKKVTPKKAKQGGVTSAKKSRNAQGYSYERHSRPDRRGLFFRWRSRR